MTKKERTLWLILKICIAIMYVLIGMWAFYRIALFAKWFYLHHEGAVRLLLWTIVPAEIPPLLLINKGAKYLANKLYKWLGVIDDYN